MFPWGAEGRDRGHWFNSVLKFANLFPLSIYRWRQRATKNWKHAKLDLRPYLKKQQQNPKNWTRSIQLLSRRIKTNPTDFPLVIDQGLRNVRVGIKWKDWRRQFSIGARGVVVVVIFASGESARIKSTATTTPAREWQEVAERQLTSG